MHITSTQTQRFVYVFIRLHEVRLRVNIIEVNLTVSSHKIQSRHSTHDKNNNNYATRGKHRTARTYKIPA